MILGLSVRTNVFLQLCDALVLLAAKLELTNTHPQVVGTHPLAQRGRKYSNVKILNPL